MIKILFVFLSFMKLMKFSPFEELYFFITIYEQNKFNIRNVQKYDQEKLEVCALQMSGVNYLYMNTRFRVTLYEEDKQSELQFQLPSKTFLKDSAFYLDDKEYVQIYKDYVFIIQRLLSYDRYKFIIKKKNQIIFQKPKQKKMKLFVYYFGNKKLFNIVFAYQENYTCIKNIKLFSDQSQINKFVLNNVTITFMEKDEEIILSGNIQYDSYLPFKENLSISLIEKFTLVNYYFQLNQKVQYKQETYFDQNKNDLRLIRIKDETQDNFIIEQINGQNCLQNTYLNNIKKYELQVVHSNQGNNNIVLLYLIEKNLFPKQLITYNLAKQLFQNNY